MSDMPICQLGLRLSQLSGIDLAAQHAQSFNHDVRYSQSYTDIRCRAHLDMAIMEGPSKVVRRKVALEIHRSKMFL